eukprot:17651_1
MSDIKQIEVLNDHDKQYSETFSGDIEVTENSYDLCNVSPLPTLNSEPDMNLVNNCHSILQQISNKQFAMDNLESLFRQVSVLKQHPKYKIMQQKNYALSDEELISLIFYTNSQKWCSRMKCFHRKLNNDNGCKMLYFHSTNAVIKLHQVFHFQNPDQPQIEALYHGSSNNVLDGFSQEELFLKTLWSFSTDINVASVFSTGSVLVLNNVSASLYSGVLKGADISWISLFDQEAEYIILPTTCYRFKNVKIQGFENLNIYTTKDYISNHNPFATHTDIVLPKMAPNYEDLMHISNQSIQICIQQLNGKIIKLSVNQNESIESVKQKIASELGYATEVQRLTFENRTLKSDRTLKCYNIKHNDKLCLILRMRGGCFVGWTKVLKSNKEETEIKNIKVGDKVLTYNFEKNKQELHRVENVLEFYLNELEVLIFDDDSVVFCTAYHPFYNPKKK